MITKHFSKFDRTMKENRKEMVESLAKKLAGEVVEQGGFSVHILMPMLGEGKGTEERTKKAINMCLFYKYGIEEMEPWLGEEHKCIQVFVPAAFNEVRREKIKRKIEKNLLPVYKENIKIAVKKLEEELQQCSERNPEWINVDIEI